MKKYQFAVLVSAKLDQNKAREVFENVKNILEKNNAKNLEELSFNQRQLAYRISKENNAYYGYVDFEIDPQKLPKIEQDLKLEKEILRYLITIWENYKSSSTREVTEIKKEEAPKAKPKAEEKEVKPKKEAEVEKPKKAPKKASKKELNEKLEELLGE